MSGGPRMALEMRLRLPEPGSFEGLLRSVRLEVAALVRLSRRPATEPYRSAGVYRFDDPDPGHAGAFGTCYTASSMAVAFAESVIHESGRFAGGSYEVPATELPERSVIRFASERRKSPMLADLTGAALKSLALNHDISASADYTASQARARAIHGASTRRDGIRYGFRQMNKGFAYATFRRRSLETNCRKYCIFTQLSLHCIGGILNQLLPKSLFSLANALVAAEQTRRGLGLAANLLGSPAISPIRGGLLGLGLATPPQTNIISGLSSLGVAAEVPKWIFVTKRFKTFQDNLALTSNHVTDGETKYKGVVSRLNAAYWGHNSEITNSFLVGSWAKGTQVRPPRDVDLYFLLPIKVYKRFEGYAAGVNKQSALLQEVKSKLLASYPTTSIKGDGPVVLAGFTSYNVEIVPAFVYNNDEHSYYVCDTKSGGSYKKTMPLYEVDAVNAADGRNSHNVRRLIRMLKAWQTSCSVPIKSFYLELLAIEFLDKCEWRNNDYYYYDWISRDFFKWMITKANTHLWTPGTYELLWLGEAWKSRAESAYARAIKACNFERANDMANAGDEWQKIYGFDIPKYV